MKKSMSANEILRYLTRIREDLVTIESVIAEALGTIRRTQQLEVRRDAQEAARAKATKKAVGKTRQRKTAASDRRR